MYEILLFWASYLVKVALSVLKVVPVADLELHFWGGGEIKIFSKPGKC